MALTSFVYGILISGFVLLSCNSHEGKSKNYTTTKDTAKDEFSKKGAQQDVNNIRSLLSPDNYIEYVKDSLRMVAEQYKKLHPNPLELVKSEIVFNSDFKPTFVAEVKNNRKVGVIALEIIINLNKIDEGKCPLIKRSIKISIPPSKTVTIKREITEQVKDGCLKLEYAKIYLGDYILANGKKKHQPNIFTDDNSEDE